MITPTLIVENCTFSEESACAGSPMYNRNQPNLANTVVCGSPNEVANDPNLPVKSTNIYQFYGGEYSIKIDFVYLQ
jgi:hypothetical protein